MVTHKQNNNHYKTNTSALILFMFFLSKLLHLSLDTTYLRVIVCVRNNKIWNLAAMLKFIGTNGGMALGIISVRWGL